MNNKEEKIESEEAENKEKKVTQVNLIAFDELIKDYQVDSPSCFVNYLAEIWRDLAKRSDDKKKGINKITFSKYYELPGLISERLFSVFDANRNDYLDPNEFINGMTILFTTSFDNLAKFIFHFYDFDHDGLITKEDVRVILSYVPLQTQGYRTQPSDCALEDFNERIESQDELFKILKNAFEDKENMDQEEFIQVIQSKSSDIFIFILLYLMAKRPFTPKTLELFESMNKDVIVPRIGQNLVQKIASPSLNSRFRSSAFININKNFDKNKTVLSSFAGKPKEHINEELDEEVVDNIGFKVDLDRKKGRSRTEKVEGIQEVEHKPKSQKEHKITAEFRFRGKIIDDEDEDFSEDENIDQKHSVNSNISSCEGYLLKISSSQQIKRIWIKLVNKDIYYYKEKTDPVHKEMHNLSGVYIKENKPFNFNNVKYYSFSIIFPKKTETFYCDNSKQYSMWMIKLKQAIDFTNLDELYEMKEDIGQGKFGTVRKGIHKLSGRIVAIKSMNKTEMRIEDLELVKTEIDVLKISQHPNIIKLYDIFENEENIYIIMEYCGGGDLFSYIQKREFKISEARACEIIHKICVAIYFIHSYGIIHRDLKPENILMTDTTDNADIRLLDFGLSKFLRPGEKCQEPFGTISYAAPELLQGKSYDKSVDLWSIGIITYLLLCGCLPFDDENDDKEIVRQTIHDPVPFYPRFWKKLSPESKAFVEGLLQKEPHKRMTIKMALEHEWLNKYNKLATIRKESSDNYCNFEMYVSTNPNSSKLKGEPGKHTC